MNRRLGAFFVVSSFLLTTTASFAQVVSPMIDKCNITCGQDFCPVQGPNCPVPPPGSLPFCSRLNPTVTFGICGGWSDASLFTTMKLSGNATWVRDGVGWDTVEAVKQSPALYDWSNSDHIHSELANLGYSILWGVQYSPAWVSGGKYMPPRSQDEVNRFYAFVKADALRYPDIRYWEPWNEPNSGNFFKGTVNDYVNLLRTMRQALSDATATDHVARFIVGPGLQNDHSPTIDPVSFYNQLWTLGGSQYIDVISDHYYGDPYHSTLDSFWQSRFALYDQRGLAGKDVWITETGARATDQNYQYAYDVIMVTYPAFNSRIKRTFIYDLQDDAFGIFDNAKHPREVYYELAEIYTLQCRCSGWPWCS